MLRGVLIIFKVIWHLQIVRTNLSLYGKDVEKLIIKETYENQ